MSLVLKFCRRVIPRGESVEIPAAHPVEHFEQCRGVGAVDGEPLDLSDLDLVSIWDVMAHDFDLDSVSRLEDDGFGFRHAIESLGTRALADLDKGRGELLPDFVDARSECAPGNDLAIVAV